MHHKTIVPLKWPKLAFRGLEGYKESKKQQEKTIQASENHLTNLQ